MTYAVIAGLRLQQETDTGITEFSGWIVLLLFSAIFWLLVARAIKSRIDGLDDAPPEATTDPAGPSDA